MPGIEFITHSGARILVADYGDLSGEGLLQQVADAGRLIRGEPDGSLLVLVIASQLTLNAETTRTLIEELRENGRHTLATAIVGLDHLERAVPVASRLTGRRIEAFADRRDALDWLASHAPPVFQSDRFVDWIEHEGQRILRIDFSHCSGHELERRVRSAALAIRSSPPGSVLALNLVQDISFDRETTSMIREYIRGNRPYMLAAAVVGLGYMKAVVPALNRMTGRSIAAFDDEESALAWLIDRARKHPAR
jgi:hypothetical protein